MDALERPISITHQHILAVINSVTRMPRTTVRILDAGCGRGEMLAYLSKALPLVRPDVTWELHGFDVTNDAVQIDAKFLQAARELMVRTDRSFLPGRISEIRSGDAWPYDANFFDIVVSNQVLEHIKDLPLFAQESARVLQEGGLGIHLFPLRAVFNEGHVHVPMAHKIGDHDLAVWWVQTANRLRIGRFRTYNHFGDSLDEFAQREADRLWNYTTYRTAREVLSEFRGAGLRATLRYTPQFYTAKVRAICGRPAKMTYSSPWEPAEWLMSRVLSRISSITVITENRNLANPGNSPDF